MIFIANGAKAVRDITGNTRRYNTCIRTAGCALTEAAYWPEYRAAQDTGGAGSCVVLIPGYSAYQANRCSRIRVSGGAVKNAHVEAESVADIPRALGVPERSLIIEAHARTSWENIGCSQPYLLDYDRILIASDSLQVHRESIMLAVRINRFVPGSALSVPANRSLHSGGTYPLPPTSFGPGSFMKVQQPIMRQSARIDANLFKSRNRTRIPFRDILARAGIVTPPASPL